MEPVEEDDDTDEEVEPEAPLPDALALPDVNADWPVYDGPITVAGEPRPQPGQVRVTWLPRPRLVWYVDAPGDDVDRPARTGAVQLALHPDSGAGQVLGARITDCSIWRELDGICDRVVLGAPDAALAWVDFLLLNFAAPTNASPLSSPSFAWAGRLRLPLGPWLVLLDTGPDSPTRQRELRRSAGFAATHTGRLVRADGSTFRPAEAVEVLDGLQLALSFALARWVAPQRLRGYDTQCQLVWREWADRQLEGWEAGRLSWWNGKRTADLVGYLQRFAAMHVDPKHGPVLNRLVHYAVAASGATTVAVEGSLQLAQACVELLAWTRLRPEMSSNREYRKLNFDGELRLLLQRASIDTQVPASLPNLRDYQRSRMAANPDLDPQHNPEKKGDAPEVLAQIRNDLTHPKLDSPEPEVYSVPGALAEAWRLSLQYVDLLILHRIDYRGSYGSRLPDRPSALDVSSVPWRHQRAASG